MPKGKAPARRKPREEPRTPQKFDMPRDPAIGGGGFFSIGPQRARLGKPSLFKGRLGSPSNPIMKQK